MFQLSKKWGIIISYDIKLKQGYDRFTKSEKVVAEYISSNPQNVAVFSIQELATESGSSTGSIMRLIKKLGYSSFTDLKLEIAKVGFPENQVESFIIDKNDDSQLISQKLLLLISETIKDVIGLMDFDKLQITNQKLNKAEKIYLLGVGGSAIPASDLHYKLIRINMPVVFHNDTHVQLFSSALSSSHDVAVVYSYSGETSEIVHAAKMHKQNGAYVVGVLRSASSSLSKICDHCIFLPNTEGEIRLGSISSRYAQLLVSDILYLLLTQGDFEKTKAYIRSTKEVIADKNSMLTAQKDIKGGELDGKFY